PLAREVPGETDHAALAGVVTDSLKLRRCSVESGDGSNVDDLASLLMDHHLAHRLGAQERAGQVRLDNFAPVFQLHGLDRSAPGGAGVIDQDVDAPEAINRRAYHLLNVALFPDVTPEPDRLDTPLAQFRGSLLTAFFLAGTKHQVRTHLGQALGHLTAQAGGPARDDGHTPAEIK